LIPELELTDSQGAARVSALHTVVLAQQEHMALKPFRSAFD